jgi:putative ABC transport system permease protein
MSHANWLGELTQDLRYTLRLLRRAPGFAALVIGTLAVGIGANATIFSVVNAVLLRPFPYAEPERLVQLFEGPRDKPERYGNVSYPDFMDWRAATHTLSGLAATFGGGANLTIGGAAERVSLVSGSASLFDVLGVRPALGRGFAPGEDDPGTGRVAVLSDGFWRRRFGADPSIVGRVLDIDGIPRTVIGVMPPDFTFPAGGSAPDLWLPLTPPIGLRTGRGAHFFDVYARLAPGVSLERANVEMRQIAARLERQYPNDNANQSARATPLREAVAGSVREPLLVLLGAVVLVLVVSCANVASLLLARAATRRHDVAVRLALGAGRGRLVRQYLIESVILALLGAVVGTAGAWGLLRVAGHAGARFLPLPGEIPLDGRVLTALLVVAIGSGLLFGLAPAFQSSLTSLRDALVGAGMKTTASATRQRSRSALVIAQIALSLVLLVGAGLLLRTFLLLAHTPAGLVAEGVVTTRLSVSRVGVDSTATSRAARVFTPLLDRLRATPGVLAAGVTTHIPLQRWGTAGSYWILGRAKPPAGQEPSAEFRIISPGYFAALGIPMRRGRDFTDRDHSTADEPAIVNEAFVRRELRGVEPIGQRIAIDDTVTFTIVGVAGDVHQAGLERPPLAEIYFTYRSQRASWLTPTNLLVKTSLPTTAAVAAVRRAVAEVAPDVPLYSVSTMDEIVGTSLGSRRLNLWLIGSFGVVTLVLAAAGLYGVVAYTVVQRTREVGIRMALGAEQREVVSLMLRYGAVRAVVGIGLGLVTAVLAVRVLATMLVGVSVTDPLTYGGVAVLLALTALAASWIPARRAARVDPMVAIRAE